MYTSLKGVSIDKKLKIINSQIHSIVLAYSLFIDMMADACMTRSGVFPIQGPAGWVGGGIKPFRCIGGGHKNPGMISQPLTVILSTSLTLRSIPLSSHEK